MTVDKKTLEAIHTALAKDLLARIESGEATATDLNVARQFLKDNGIDCAPDVSAPMLNLAKIMPYDEEAA